MPDEILVFAEHQAGKIARAAWEAIAAGQQLAQSLGLNVSAVILAGNSSGLAAEIAAAELHQILAVDSPQLAEYTADGYAEALGQLVR